MPVCVHLRKIPVFGVGVVFVMCGEFLYAPQEHLSIHSILHPAHCTYRDAIPELNYGGPICVESLRCVDFEASVHVTFDVLPNRFQKGVANLVCGYCHDIIRRINNCLCKSMLSRSTT